MNTDEITDTDRINYLQELNDRKRFTGKCVLRESTTGRGWRLHETDKNGGFYNVRVAIDHAMITEKFETE